MEDYLKSGIDCFDELFNDDFVQNASDEDIEVRFQYLQETCKRKNISFQKLLDELEFNCNSFIEDIIRP